MFAASRLKPLIHLRLVIAALKRYATQNRAKLFPMTLVFA